MRDDAYAAALGGLTGATPLRLHLLLEGRSASEAFSVIESSLLGTEVAPVDVLAEWQREISRIDLAAVSARLDEVDARVSTLHEPAHPLQLINDVDPAPLLFCRGSLPDPSLAHVAVVGTSPCLVYRSRGSTRTWYGSGERGRCRGLRVGLGN